MRLRNLGAIVAGALLTASAIPTFAHHSFAAEFDVTRPIRLSGVVQRMEFSNPHSWIYIEVTTNDGDVQEWAIEGAAPNALLRRGWNRNLPIPGRCRPVQDMDRNSIPMPGWFISTR